MMAFTITDAGALATLQAAGHPATGQTTALVLAEPAQAPQAPSQFPGEAEGGTVMILVIGGFLWYILKHKKAKPTHVVASFVAGVLLAGSMFGLMARQVSASLGTGLQTMLTTTTGGGSGGGSGTGR